ncbi:MAG: GNAT family N-acetyltransferase, partial [Bacteroidota bacterium]
PMDDEWLRAVLNEASVQQYSVFHESELIAVLGIVRANEQYSYSVITDVAIKPSMRKRGLGKAVLRQLLQLESKERPARWRAYVNKRNVPALRCFESLGWRRSSDADSELWCFEWELS